MQPRVSRARLVTAGLLVGALLAACASDGAPDVDAEAAGADDEQQAAGEPSGEPRHGGSIAVALEAETAGWAPWQDSWANAGSLVSTAFYDRIAGRDEDGQVQPVLAEAIEPDEDFMAYTITLREGIEFHDGEPLNAEAVATNLAKHREPGSQTASQVAPIEDVVVEDDLTVRIELDQPHVAFADYLVGAVGVVVSPASIEAETVSEEPVGTGPFVFESWQRDQQLEVSRNEDYWREGLPYLESVTFRPIPDEDARLQSLFSGDVDAMQTLRQSIIAQARERDDEFNLYEDMGNNSGATILNTAVPPFDDERVRRAWAHAIDQEELIAVLGGTGISPASKGLFNPESPWFVDEMEDIWPSEDLEQAQEYADDYINDPDRSDGEEPGTPIRFDFDTQPDPSLLETSSVYQAQVERVGLEMNIETVEQAVHIQEAVGEPPEFEGQYQAKIFRMGLESDPDWMVPYFAEGSPQNFTNYNNEEMFGLLIQARQTPDVDERRELYHQVQQILAEDVPFTLTGHTASMIGTAGDVYGLDGWELPDGDDGVGHPEAIARWHSVWRDQ